MTQCARENANLRIYFCAINSETGTTYGKTARTQNTCSVSLLNFCRNIFLFDILRGLRCRCARKNRQIFMQRVNYCCPTFTTTIIRQQILVKIPKTKVSRDCIIGNSQSLWAGRSRNRMPAEARFSATVQTGPGDHPDSCTMSIGSFPEIKSRIMTLTTRPPLARG